MTSILAMILAAPLGYSQPAPDVTILELPPHQVARACAKHFGWMAQGVHAEACADPVARLIILPAMGTISPTRFACIWRHELAHINGWPHDHPNGTEENCP